MVFHTTVLKLCSQNPGSVNILLLLLLFLKLVIMFIENKQSQHFSSHTHECLFLSPELCLIPQYFKISWVNTVVYYMLIATKL